MGWAITYFSIVGIQGSPHLAYRCIGCAPVHANTALGTTYLSALHSSRPFLRGSTLRSIPDNPEVPSVAQFHQGAHFSVLSPRPRRTHLKVVRYPKHFAQLFRFLEIKLFVARCSTPLASNSRLHMMRRKQGWSLAARIAFVCFVLLKIR